MAEDGFGGDIQAALLQLGMVQKAIRDAMPEAVAAGGEILERAAAAAAPRLTGYLAGASGHEPAEESGNDSAAERVFFTAYHARFQEFGVGHHAAQPFLRPAAEANQSQIEEAMGDIIRAAAGEAIVSYRGVMTSQ